MVNLFGHLQNLINSNISVIDAIFAAIFFVLSSVAAKYFHNYKIVRSNEKKLEIKHNPIIVIGITGRKRSGKDTIGKYLVETHGFARVAFADALKEACKDIFGFSDEQVYGDDLKEVVDDYWKYSPREILQKVGTELFREELSKLFENISDDIWIRSVERKIQNLKDQGYTKFVITDVRFPNELDFISKINGMSWKVTRPSMIASNSIGNIHASEALIDNFNCDDEFINNRTINDLLKNVDIKVNNIYRKSNNTTHPIKANVL